MRRLLSLLALPVALAAESPTERIWTDVTPGMVARVKALNAKGLEGWDWAQVTLTP